MNKKKFQSILKRYVQGSASDAERALIDQWYELLDEETPEVNLHADIQLVEKRLWEKIKTQTFTKEHSSAPVFSINTNHKVELLHLWSKRLAFAAVSIGVLFLIVSQFQSVQSERTTALKPVISGLEKKENRTGKPMIFQLEDGSKITLQPNAKLSYPLHFAHDKREVYLEGEAFFDVHKNPNQPFFVYSRNIVTHVLGTSFNVKPIPGKNEIEVSVRTGRVEVFENNSLIAENKTKKSNGVVLTPNQKVVYNSTSRQFEPSIVDVPIPLTQNISKSGSSVSFSFEETPLAEVLQSLEKVYGIEIIVDKESLYGCPFTGDITDQDLYSKLDIINKVLNTTYEIKGVKILIKGDGCE
ncbi:FecR family protein [Lacibacter sp.]|uniref:FecR family protein n=1 Tax=Lacibacter sp. TaxID=1915409 RepID=UPI002B4AF689|nr:FecR family protein [Lacibacter sp.]HLP38179.1 FecR family protein [Lacibacter sp.]